MALAAKAAADVQVTEAEKGVASSKEIIADGAYGFFTWMGSTEITDYEEWSYTTKSSAMDALLNPYYAGFYGSDFNKPTRGQEGDATSFARMYEELDMIDVCNGLRRGEGLNELKVSLKLWGVAQSNANFISYHFQHAGGLGAENIARGSDNPFDVWYYVEKEDPSFIGTDGHYKNIVNPDVTATGYGIRINKNGVPYHSQIFGWTGETYTTDECRALIKKYISEVTDGANQKLNDAKALKEQADAFYGEVSKVYGEAGGDAASLSASSSSGSASEVLASAKSSYGALSSYRDAFLKAQASYVSAKDTYEAAHQALFTKQEAISSLEKEIASLSSQISSSEREKASLEAAIPTLQSECTSLSSQVSTLERQLTSEAQVLSSHTGLLNAAKDSLSRANEEVNRASNQVASYDTAVTNAKNALLSAQSAYNTALSNKSRLEQEVKNKEAAYNSACASYEAALSQKEKAANAYTLCVTAVKAAKSKENHGKGTYVSKSDMLGGLGNYKGLRSKLKAALTKAEKACAEAKEILSIKQREAKVAALSLMQVEANMASDTDGSFDLMFPPVYDGGFDEALGGASTGTSSGTSSGVSGVVFDEGSGSVSDGASGFVSGISYSDASGSSVSLDGELFVLPSVSDLSYEEALSNKEKADAAYEQANQAYALALFDLAQAQDAYHAYEEEALDDEEVSAETDKVSGKTDAGSSKTGSADDGSADDGSTGFVFLESEGGLLGDASRSEGVSSVSSESEGAKSEGISAEPASNTTTRSGKSMADVGTMEDSGASKINKVKATSVSGEISKEQVEDSKNNASSVAAFRVFGHVVPFDTLFASVRKGVALIAGCGLLFAGGVLFKRKREKR